MFTNQNKYLLLYRVVFSESSTIRRSLGMISSLFLNLLKKTKKKLVRPHVQVKYRDGRITLLRNQYTLILYCSQKNDSECRVQKGQVDYFKFLKMVNINIQYITVDPKSKN